MNKAYTKYVTDNSATKLVLHTFRIAVIMRIGGRLSW